jgi:hypothetical protein
MNNKMLGFIFAGITIISTVLPYEQCVAFGQRSSIDGIEHGAGVIILLLAGTAIGFHFVDKTKRFAAFVMAGAALFSIISFIESWNGLDAMCGPGLGVLIAIVASLLGTFFMFRVRSKE